MKRGALEGVVQMDTASYIGRIDYRGRLDPTVPVLASVHRAHMLSVPFENLDIPLGRRIDMSLPSFFDKIVRRRRGGFCYELNGLFGWLLEQLGFRVALLSGRVYNADRPGREFDHMVLLVELETSWIADVGFGDSFIEPIPLCSGEQLQRGVAYRLIMADDGRVLEARRPGKGWEPQYAFSMTRHRLQDFAAMCHYQQTSPASSFTRKSVCSRATPGGRITLANGRLIVTEGERRDEREVAGEKEYRELLELHFGIVLHEQADVGRLMGPARR